MGDSLLGIHIEKLAFNLPFFDKPNRQLIKLINRMVCYNQGRYIEFEYLLGLKHKDIKDELPVSPGSERLTACCEELLRFAYFELQQITEKNFKFIIEYFTGSGRSKIPPRVCIKALHNDRIVDLFRNKRGRYYVKEHPIKSNSGIEYVFQNGMYYIQNDIAMQAKQGHYKNPRIIDQRVRNYSKPFRWPYSDSSDERWISCWTNNDDDSPPHPESCYKSTLIIPMTLLNNDLSDEFRKSFFRNSVQGDRTIWGFLCLDHVKTDYFLDEMDRMLGYLFADILSLYYISTYIHTENSGSFSRAMKRVNPDTIKLEGALWNPNMVQ